MSSSKHVGVAVASIGQQEHCKKTYVRKRAVSYGEHYTSLDTSFVTLSLELVQQWDAEFKMHFAWMARDIRIYGRGKVAVVTRWLSTIYIVIRWSNVIGTGDSWWPSWLAKATILVVLRSGHRVRATRTCYLEREREREKEGIENL